MAKMREDSTAQRERAEKQLNEALRHVEGLETERTSLRAELETTLAQLRIKERELDNAESVAYRPPTLAKKLTEMSADGSVLAALSLMTEEGKAELLAQLLASCNAEAKNGVMMSTFFSAFDPNEMEMKALLGAVDSKHHPRMLQALLEGCSHSAHQMLLVYNCSSEKNKELFSKKMAQIMKEAKTKGMSMLKLMRLAGITEEDSLKAMLSKHGANKALSMLMDKAEQLELELPEASAGQLGLVPAALDSAGPGTAQTTEAETQTEATVEAAALEEEDATPEPEAQTTERKQRPQIKRHRSKILKSFDSVPKPGHKHAPKAMTQSALRKKIAQIYEEKVRADEVDDLDGVRRQPLPDFLHEYFVNQYGLKSLADKNIAKFVQGVRHHTPDGDKATDSRVYMFGLLSGIVDGHNFNGVTVNFMMDLLERLFEANLIQQHLDREDCPVALEQAELCVAHNLEHYRMSTCKGQLIAELREIAVETPGHAEGNAPAMSLGFDPFFECVHKHFLVSLAECDNALLEIFTRFDADGDGGLTLDEFKNMVDAIDAETHRVATSGAGTEGRKRKKRSKRKIIKMYTEAIAESQGDDEISPGGFLNIAYFYNLGVGVSPDVREGRAPTAKGDGDGDGISS